MRITFICFGLENLGVEQISAVLKAQGHDVCLVFDPCLFRDYFLMDQAFLSSLFDQEDRMIRDTLSSSPDLIAFSVLSHFYQRACLFAKRIKEKSNIPIIFGGIHPTVVPEKVLANSFVDMVCIGEGEHAMLELADNLKHGGSYKAVRNIWHKHGGDIVRTPIRERIADLDSLPLLDKALFENEISFRDIYITMASRGCLFRCSYCPVPGIYEGPPRVHRRSVSHVLNELIVMKKKYHFRHVRFEDDLFTDDKKWLKDFLMSYKKFITLPFTCQSHANCFDEEEGYLLKESGCERIVFGVQSVNENVRRKLLNRFTSQENLNKVFGICDKIGLNYSIHHILGLPFQEDIDLINAAKFYNKLKKCSRITSHYYVSFPKTQLTGLLVDKGMIDQKELNDIEEGRLEPYLFGGKGSIAKNKYLVARCRCFEILFYMTSVFPECFVDFIIEKKIYVCFSFIYMPLIYVMSIFIGIRGGDYRFLDFGRHYARHIYRFFIKGIKRRL